MHRFFVEKELLADLAPTRSATIFPVGFRGEIAAASIGDAGPMFSLPKELAHQVRDVLHLAIGEQFLLLDDSGDEIVAAIEKNSRAGVDVRLLERRAGKSEPRLRVILCQGLLKSAHFEWILQKGTELGVATFVPTLCRRSTLGLEDAGPTKIQRWQRIIREAAEQCGRSRLPELLPIRPLMHVLYEIPAGALAIMPWEEEREQSLRHVLSSVQIERSSYPFTVVLFIGPEGGFMPEEVVLARHSGVQVVTLGALILRAETAALATVADVMYELA